MIVEAIKGGMGALKSLLENYKEFQTEMVDYLQSVSDISTQEVLSMLLIQYQHTKSVIGDLITQQVISEKEYSWKSRPRCYSVEGDITVEMLALKESYKYEYLGDCVQPVWYTSMERTIYNFFSSYIMKYFPLLKGSFSTGKSTTVVEAARLVGQNLVSRSTSCLSQPDMIEMVKKIVFYFYQLQFRRK